jgi:hypothetical protein
MYKSRQAAIAIYEHDSSINTEWLDILTIDTDRMEISKDDNEQLTKGFIRGLIAAKAVGIELLDDLDL